MSTVRQLSLLTSTASVSNVSRQAFYRRLATERPVYQEVCVLSSFSYCSTGYSFQLLQTTMLMEEGGLSSVLFTIESQFSSKSDCRHRIFRRTPGTQVTQQIAVNMHLLELVIS
ncbi:hypothetical protein NPIL_480691 [Nephila pilipes]|uniref:Uncharacterized protein n=1 Tax=Nephila pilipes TaxID=299642 RepID=A0A8X6M8J3_NEPPI|nr:hypothetical protein NPIL_480691 [Nephila pilipes]